MGLTAQISILLSVSSFQESCDIVYTNHMLWTIPTNF